MSNAGYGSHDAPKPGSKAAEAVERPTGTPKPADDRGREATPGDGAGPDGPQGDEVDPGTG